MKHEIKSIQTKTAMADALKACMRKKPLSKISVTDIVNISGVNRKTFYYHFEDLYSLLRWSLEQDSAELVKQFELAIDLNEIIMFVMDYIESNDYLISSVLGSSGLDAMKSFFFNDFLHVTEALIDQAERRAEIKIDEKYKQFLCIFYTTAIDGILFDWLKSKNRSDNKQLVCEMIYKTVTNSLQGALNPDII